MSSSRNIVELPESVPASLGHIGALEVRLARSASEVRKAQALRYKVFYQEMAAVPSVAARVLRRDTDEFDAICDHVLVIDHDAKSKTLRKGKVVGTYRLLRQSVAQAHDGFYTSGEYDIDALLARHQEFQFLELGRSCVLKPYRNKKTIELLWHGVWAYILHYKLDALIGCASLEGTHIEQLAAQLSFLHHNCLAEAQWLATALPDLRVEMNLIPKDKLNAKEALKALPPLVKGYLRLGAMIGDGAVIDRQFNTTDVLMVLPVSKISEKYIGYFGKGADRFER